MNEIAAVATQVGRTSRWNGSVYAQRGRLMLKFKDGGGNWVARVTDLADTPENRVKARAALEEIRRSAVPVLLGSKPKAPPKWKCKSNGRNLSFKRRRGWACEVCGWTPRPPLRPSAANAHHVRPREEGGDDSDENRIVLCPNHHAVAHALHRERPAKDRDELLARIRNPHLGRVVLMQPRKLVNDFFNGHCGSPPGPW